MRRVILLALLVLAATPARALAAPVVSTDPATSIGADTAILHGTVDPGGAAVYRFEYGTTSDYGSNTGDRALAGSSPEDVSAALDGLDPDTTYHYRVVAWPAGDENAKVYGADRTFHTIAPPRVGSGVVRDTRVDGTTLHGKVDPNGSPTRWWFEYGPTREYGARTPESEARGSAMREVTATLDGLQPGTTYHFRLVAQNAAGIRRGGDRSFKTLLSPSGITVGNELRWVRFGALTTLRGRVEVAGGARVRVALQAQPFPFKAGFVDTDATAITAADGSFSLVSPPLWITTRLRVVTKTTILAVSPEVTAFSRVLVGAHVTAIDRRRSRIEGNVIPNVRGARVSVQRRKGKKWVFVHRTTASRLARGRYGYRVTVRRDRRAREYRVIVTPKTLAHGRGVSRTVTVPKRPGRAKPRG